MPGKCILCLGSWANFDTIKALNAYLIFTLMVSISLCSHLYVLQGGLAQQEWRVPELLHRLLSYLEPKLTQVYKNVRERIGRYVCV